MGLHDTIVGSRYGCSRLNPDQPGPKTDKKRAEKSAAPLSFRVVFLSPTREPRFYPAHYYCLLPGNLPLPLCEFCWCCAQKVPRTQIAARVGTEIWYERTALILIVYCADSVLLCSTAVGLIAKNLVGLGFLLCDPTVTNTASVLKWSVRFDQIY